VSRVLVGNRENRVGEPAAKRFIIAELLEEFRVVLQDRYHDAGEGLVVLNAGILAVGVLLRVLVGGVMTPTGEKVDQ
jgi:hypothetical protein